MARSKLLRSAKDLEKLIPDPLFRDLTKIIIGGAVGGFTFGIGLHFAQILIQGTIKEAEQVIPELVPDIISEGARS